MPSAGSDGSVGALKINFSGQYHSAGAELCFTSVTSTAQHIAILFVKSLECFFSLTLDFGELHNSSEASFPA